MTDYTDTPTFSSEGELNAEVALTGSWSGLGNFIVSGFLVEQARKSEIFHISRYLGEVNVPKDVRRLRRYVHELMRRVGQPVLIKHMFLDSDVKAGLAEPSPAFQDIYGQTRNRDPFSYGSGYCSVEKSPDEWISPDGQIVDANTLPGPGYVPAPKYRGFGPGYLTHLIEPDAATDFFKLSETGALIEVQTATAVTSWFPNINDNDLVINVTLDQSGEIVDTSRRYQAKMTNPVSIRGLDRMGRQEYSGDSGNRHVVNQTFEMTLVPPNNVLMEVEVDR